MKNRFAILLIVYLGLSVVSSVRADYIGKILTWVYNTRALVFIDAVDDTYHYSGYASWKFYEPDTYWYVPFYASSEVGGAPTTESLYADSTVYFAQRYMSAAGSAEEAGAYSASIGVQWGTGQVVDSFSSVFPLFQPALTEFYEPEELQPARETPYYEGN